MYTVLRFDQREERLLFAPSENEAPGQSTPGDELEWDAVVVTPGSGVRTFTRKLQKEGSCPSTNNLCTPDSGAFGVVTPPGTILPS